MYQNLNRKKLGFVLGFFCLYMLVMPFMSQDGTKTHHLGEKKSKIEEPQTPQTVEPQVQRPQEAEPQPKSKRKSQIVQHQAQSRHKGQIEERRAQSQHKYDRQNRRQKFLEKREMMGNRMKISWCKHMGWKKPAGPVTALVSFPGSGNTWVRYLLQQATGWTLGDGAIAQYD